MKQACKDLNIRIFTARSGHGLNGYTYKFVQIGGFKGQSNDNIVMEQELKKVEDLDPVEIVLDYRGGGKGLKISKLELMEIIKKHKPKRNQWKMLSKMIKIVSDEFAGKLDRGGRPYVLHCLRVMDGVDQNDPELMQIAVGHDLLEDIDSWDIDRLRKEHFSERVIEGLRLLDHKPEVEYMDYIYALSKNKDAKEVKKSDLRDNSKVSRLKSLRQKDFERLEKYVRAYAYLVDGIEDPKK